MAIAIDHFESGTDFTGTRANSRPFRMAVLVPVSLAHAAVVILAAHGIALSPPPVTPPEPIIVSLVEEAPPSAQLAPAPEPITPTIQPATRSITRAVPRPKSLPHPVESAVAPAPESQPVAARSESSDVAPAVAAGPSDDVAPVVTPPRADAAYLSNPPPEYPATAKRDHQQGRVVLRVLVAADGAAREVAVEQGCGFPLLDDAAASAVRHWRFVPARRGEAAIDDWVLIPISFKLRA